LIAATLPLIRTYGPDVSTRQIAEAACVAEGTIFRVFPDKESLIDEAISSAFDPVSAVAQLRGIDMSLPLEDRLTEAVQLLHARVTAVVALIMALRRRPPTADDDRQDRRKQDEIVNRAVVALIEPDRAQLRVPPAEAARLLRFLTVASAMPWLNEGKPLRPRQIVLTVLDGVRKRETN
jgi:AcrR family transcriptional regulator